MLELEVLVRETVAVDRLATSTVTASCYEHRKCRTRSQDRASALLTEVTALDHEVFDDTVELGALVTHTLREGGTILLDTSRESTEVLDGLGDGLCARRLVLTQLSRVSYQRTPP